MTISALRHEVDELRAALARRGTMKQTLRCACGGREILQFRRVVVEGRAGLQELSLQIDKEFWGESVRPLRSLRVCLLRVYRVARAVPGVASNQMMR